MKYFISALVILSAIMLRTFIGPERPRHPTRDEIVTESRGARAATAATPAYIVAQSDTSLSVNPLLADQRLYALPDAVLRTEGLTSLSYASMRPSGLSAIQRDIDRAAGRTGRYRDSNKLSTLDGIGRLSGLTHLKLLAIEPDIDLAPLAALSHLSVLELSHPGLNLCETLHQLDGLRSLRIGGVGPADLSCIGQLHHLQELELWRLDSLSPEQLSQLLTMPQIGSITLRFPIRIVPPCPDLRHVIPPQAWSPYLAELTLEHCDTSTSHLDALELGPSGRSHDSGVTLRIGYPDRQIP